MVRSPKEMFRTPSVGPCVSPCTGSSASAATFPVHSCPLSQEPSPHRFEDRGAADVTPLRLRGRRVFGGGRRLGPVIRRWGPMGPPLRSGSRPDACGAAAILAAPWTPSIPMLGLFPLPDLFRQRPGDGPAWAAAADIGGKHTGVLSGTMNMMASFTAALAPSSPVICSSRATGPRRSSSSRPVI